MVCHEVIDISLEINSADFGQGPSVVQFSFRFIEARQESVSPSEGRDFDLIKEALYSFQIGRRRILAPGEDINELIPSG